MADEDDLESLVPIVLEKTKQGKIAWEHLIGDSYIARLGRGSLELNQGKARGTILVLRDEEGLTLASIAYADMGPPVDEMLQDLFVSAKRKALKVDEVLTSLKDTLKNL